MSIYPDALAKFLREKFKIKGERRGVEGVIVTGNIYQNVALELSAFTLGDYEIEFLFEAKRLGLCSGFFFTPRLERKSQARHYILFH